MNEKISTKLITIIILSSLIVGGVGSWVFNRFLIPKINTIPFLMKYNLSPSGSPLVINTKQEIRVNEGSDTVAVVSKVRPWVVGLAYGNDFNNADFRGSGIILTSDGLIAVPAQSLYAQSSKQQLKIVFDDGKVLPATLKAMDTDSNLALVKVDANSLPTASVGLAADLQLGQRIIVVAKTLNEFNPNVFVSFVSSQTHNHPAQSYFADDFNQVFKFSPDEAPNNSIIFSLEGNIVGIKTRTGIITAEALKNALNSYFKNGAIVKNVFGFFYLPISLSDATAFNGTQGAWVHNTDYSRNFSIIEGSPAAKAGLQAGDIITAVNDEKVTLQNSFEDLSLKYSPGDVIRLEVKRGKTTKTLNLTIGAKKYGTGPGF